jgi:hypothetical protein
MSGGRKKVKIKAGVSVTLNPSGSKARARPAATSPAL